MVRDRQSRWAVFALLAVACESGPGQPVASQGGSLEGVSSAAPADAESARTAERPSCRPISLDDGCAVGKSERPSPSKDDSILSAAAGSEIFSYGRAEDFDPETVRWATATSCLLWLNVFVTDRTDVYVLEPMSCGGVNCGGDYTGFGWGRLYVRHTPSFRWLASGYAVDQRWVYHRWAEGPLDGARPDHFDLLLCGGDDGFVVGRDDGRGVYDGRPPQVKWYRDGKRVDEAAAFDPSPPTQKRPD